MTFIGIYKSAAGIGVVMDISDERVSGCKAGHIQGQSVAWL